VGVYVEVVRPLHAEQPETVMMKWFTQRLDKPTTQQRILCPFHEEKTPSCLVDTLRGRYHCLGCGRIGPIEDLPKDED
jgi:DNA primase